MRDRVTRQCPQTTTTFEQLKRKERRRGLKRGPSACQPYRSAKPSHMSSEVSLCCLTSTEVRRPVRDGLSSGVSTFYFTSTEARWLIRDGDRWGRGRKSEGSTADTARKRPERPWTAARTMEVLRRCPFAIAQRLVHCAIAV